MYACSIILPFAYLVGLLFTLKTHSYIFENVEPDEQVLSPCPPLSPHPHVAPCLARQKR
jgi:Ca2+/H+ antiporter